MTDEKKINPEEEALKFLLADFNLAFAKMQFYDTQIFDSLKFLFTAYTLLLGIVGVFDKLGINQCTTISLTTQLLLLMGVFIGIVIFAIIVRNRVYFVEVARYVNAQRGTFLKLQPLKFTNPSHIYIDPNYPRFFNCYSTQTFLYITIAALNSLLFGAFLFLSCINYSGVLVITIVGSFILFFIQIIPAILYLQGREIKGTAEQRGSDEATEKK